MTHQELLSIESSINPEKNIWLILISPNSSNIHGCSNVMISAEPELFLTLTSGKEPKTISPLFLWTEKKNFSMIKPEIGSEDIKEWALT